VTKSLVICWRSSLRERSLSLRLGVEELDYVMLDIYITIAIHLNFGINGIIWQFMEIASGENC
jgi:hypothetical protein